MGKATVQAPPRRRAPEIAADGGGCVILSESCDCCISTDVNNTKTVFDFKVLPDLKPLSSASGDDVEDDIRELLVIGAGPHAFALALRLLEPEVDLMSDKERHLCADYHHRMRPLSQVRKHVDNLFHGPKVLLKQKKKVSKKGRHNNACEDPPPALPLNFFRSKCTVIDTEGSNGWMANWKRNFSALKIEQLRSPISAHCDPYDHRGLEFFAEKLKRNEELLPLKHMNKSIKRWDFHGPFNAPSTKLFEDFHDQLAEGYGIKDMVQGGEVFDVKVLPPSGLGRVEPIFAVSFRNLSGSTILKTKRLVCALGPAVPQNPTHDNTFPWEAVLKKQISSTGVTYSDYVLRGPQILEWLSKTNTSLKNSRILIVGGGITSGHLVLVAKSRDVSSITFIQRSPLLERQFDLDSSWMGPGRGKLQESFCALSLEERSMLIKKARGGGSISPEVARLLSQKRSGCTRIDMKECVELDKVQMMSDGSLEATLDDGSSWQGDMIWLATGFANTLENHPILCKLAASLPISTMDGLPVLNTDLSWGIGEGEVAWKSIARKRCWIMGAMAALELGPDALNLMGARRGAVHVAKAIRSDLALGISD